MFLKRATICILIITFLFNVSGYFVAFKVLQYQVRKEIQCQIKQQLRTSDLTIIVINKTDKSSILWEEENKEFYYEGAFYDIVKSSETTDSITYHCINDEQEEQLFDDLEVHIDRYVATEEYDKNRSAKKLVKPYIKLYFNESFLLAYHFCNSQTTFIFKQPLYTSALIEINSPPPDFI